MKKVMIIDDATTIRKTFEAYIKEFGFEMMGCENGIDAIEKVVDFNPDIIFCDIMMPEMDGYSTIALLRSNPATRHIPIIVLSSKSGVFDVARGKLIGCDSYIVKPTTKIALQKCIAEHTGGQVDEEQPA